MMPVELQDEEKVDMFAPVLQFEGLGPCYYVLDTFRCPRKGEYYLSGTNEDGQPDGWRAPNDLITEYRVVRPTFKAKRAQVWAVGEPISKDDE
jgi:hypothetical protein